MAEVEPGPGTGASEDAVNIQEAFDAAKAIFPDDSGLSVTIEYTMRASGKVQAIRWIHSCELEHRCISSYHSWEHALAIALAGNDDRWPEVDESMDEPVSAQ
jgi:hypothetical protein